MEKKKLSKEADLLLALLPYFFVVSNYLIRGFYDKGMPLLYYYLDFFDLIEGNNHCLSFPTNHSVLIFSIIAVLLVINLLKLWKYKFYYVWLGFGGTLSLILILINFSYTTREWMKSSYLSNYVFMNKTFIKRAEAYIITLFVIIILLLLLKWKKVCLNDMINLIFSSYFALSIFQNVFYFYDAPDILIPYPETVVKATILYSFFVFVLAFVLLTMSSCKKKLIVWAISFPFIAALLRIDIVFTHFESRSVILEYLNYFFIRSDLVFYFVLLSVLCYLKNGKIKNVVSRQ